MKLEHVLLSLLARKPYHGYELLKWFEVEGQFVRSNVHHSQIYRELARLVRAGHATYELDPREGRPDAKVYRITPAGRAALLAWVRSDFEPPSRFEDADFKVRFGFAVGVDLRAALRIVESELAYRRAQVARSRGRDLTVHSHDAIPEFDPEAAARYGLMTHAYGADAVDRWIAWLDGVRESLVADIAARDGAG
ncbi:PadR family transcriptional regulator [Isoptericola sp. BMS4]|uniref:PadR family transcriptional regulator n=1 Tax=Isoptericola sp. BMS4 TaxID=2527875 RepID=UPI001422D303|nr:PadR family transcriptional regulator [Isoptericola sp. BMS4]